MKNYKLSYYLSNALMRLVPSQFFRNRLAKELSRLEQYDKHYIEDRVNYYNKISTPFELPEGESTRVQNFKKTKGWTYYFDLWSTLKYFPKKSQFCYLNGDITHVPEYPTFVKSRPISGENQNSTLLKLNKVRHFLFVNDPIPYHAKKDMVVWRGVGYQPRRQLVLKQFYNNPRCDIGQVKPINGDPWEKTYLSIKEQLQYKFVLCIEGNDVATNLKWAMSSNSLCIMSKPTCETWFMEGKLKPGIHFVEVKKDYSNLIEKIDYYLENEEEALEIINNSNHFVSEFLDPGREKLIGLMVANKYFANTNKK